MNNMYFNKIERLEHLWHKANTKVAYLLAHSTIPFVKNYLINWFLDNYEVDLEEFENKTVEEYKNFNDFFTRPIKSSARPIDNEKKAIVSSVDGTISQYGKINGSTLIQAKNIDYSIQELIDDEGKEYQNGNFITIYLAPTDYHRIHMPFTANMTSSKYIPGRLFSVQPSIIENTKAVFTRNERLVCHFDSAYGKFSMVLVGAQLVSGLETKQHGKIARSRKIKKWPDSNVEFEKGKELGRFNFGSTVIMCFDDNIKFNDQLKIASKIKLGENIASYRAK